jgi:hypothetical protein
MNYLKLALAFEGEDDYTYEIGHLLAACVLGPNACTRRVAGQIRAVHWSRRRARLADWLCRHVFVEYEVAIGINLHSKVIFEHAVRFVLLEEAATNSSSSTGISTDRELSSSTDGST